MKATKSLIILSLILAVSTITYAKVSKKRQNDPSATRKVLIYLQTYNPSRTSTSAEYLLSLMPVERDVRAASPARGALEALLAGPTPAEKGKGLDSPHAYQLRIRRLFIRDATAYVSLRSTCGDCLRWPGHNAPGRFREAIARTLKQFPSIRKVVICLDGYEDFGRSDSASLIRCK